MCWIAYQQSVTRLWILNELFAADINTEQKSDIGKKHIPTKLKPKQDKRKSILCVYFISLFFPHLSRPKFRVFVPREFGSWLGKANSAADSADVTCSEKKINKGSRGQSKCSEANMFLPLTLRTLFKTKPIVNPKFGTVVTADIEKKCCSCWCSTLNDCCNSPQLSKCFHLNLFNWQQAGVLI